MGHGNCLPGSVKILAGKATAPPTNGQALSPARSEPRSCVGTLWFLALIAATLIGVATPFDWNLLRQPAERLAGRVTGGVVTIGHLSVRVSLTPTIIVEDLIVSNVRDPETKPLARASRVEFNLHLPSLLSNEVVLPHLDLTDADINLIRSADGTSN